MLRLSCGSWESSCFLLLLVSLAANSALAQLETATVSGQVVDPSGLSITGAQVKLVDIDRDTSTGAPPTILACTRFASVRPGRYRMEVRCGRIQDSQCHRPDGERPGSHRAKFSSSGWLGGGERDGGSAGAPLVNTTDATVSTSWIVSLPRILPLNGRSFQTLIQLTPGVVLTPSSYASTMGNSASMGSARTPTTGWWTV